MNELFEDLQPYEKLPEEIKAEVFKSLDSIEFVADFLDLFTIKFSQTEAEFLDYVNKAPGPNLENGDRENEIQRH